MAAVSRLRGAGIPRDCLVRVYNALVEPLLTYAILSWGGGYAKFSNRMQVLQNDALRAIEGLPRYHSSFPVRSLYCILPISHLYKLRLAVVSYNSHYSQS